MPLPSLVEIASTIELVRNGRIFVELVAVPEGWR
jgi:hypothetical protein